MQVDLRVFNRALRELDTLYVETLVYENLKRGIPAHIILNNGLIGAMAMVGQDFKAKKPKGTRKMKKEDKLEKH